MENDGDSVSLLVRVVLIVQILYSTNNPNPLIKSHIGENYARYVEPVGIT